MNISINVGEEAPRDLAGKVRAWEQIAARHISSGEARVLSGPASCGSADIGDRAVPGKPATPATSRAVVGSVAPEGDQNTGYFLSDMFQRVTAEQRKAGKSFNAANEIARAKCNEWREANLQGVHLHASSGGA